MFFLCKLFPNFCLFATYAVIGRTGRRQKFSLLARLATFHLEPFFPIKFNAECSNYPNNQSTYMCKPGMLSSHPSRTNETLFKAFYEDSNTGLASNIKITVCSAPLALRV